MLKTKSRQSHRQLFIKMVYQIRKENLKNTTLLFKIKVITNLSGPTTGKMKSEKFPIKSQEKSGGEKNECRKIG